MTWNAVAFRDLGQWYGGGTPSKSNAAFWQDGTVPWLSPKDMGPAVLNSTIDRITDTAVEKSSVRLVPENSVAIVARSGILERTLPVGLVPFATTLNQDMKAVIARPDIDPRWIAWGLRAFERDLLRDTRKAGTTVASIEMPRFYAYTLPVPGLSEQRRIVEILEDHLSRLDAAADYASAADRRLAGLQEAGLREALSRVHVDHRPLNEVLSTPLTNGRSVPTRDGGFPVLRLTALRPDGVDLTQRKGGDWSADDAERFLVAQDDYLISRGNGSLRLVGRGSLVRDAPDPVAYPDTAVRARPNQSVISTEYLDTIWNSRAVRAQVEAMARTTAGIYKVNQKQLGAVRLPIPSMDDQSAVARGVFSIREAIRPLEAARREADARTSALRRAVLAAAFSGKLSGRRTDVEVIEELAGAMA